MGNCGSNPKTDEGPDDEPAVPEPVMIQREVKVEQQEKKPEENENVVEANTTEEIPVSSYDNSLGTLLNEKKEEAPNTEEVKEVVKEAEPTEEEPKTEEVKVQEEKPNTEEAKTIEA